MESFMFLGFGIDAWITIVTVLGMFTVLLTTKLRTDLVFLGAIGTLCVTGVLDAKEAFSGFSSTSVVVIGVLFVVVAGLTYTGVLQWIVKNLLGTPNSYSRAVTRLMVPVAVLSSFLSNTTVVALFVNIVKMWSKKLGVSPSKLLIPLSYASGMGGVCTLIGTPPNMIISGLYADNTGKTMNILATAIPGLFCLAVGVLSVIGVMPLLQCALIAAAAMLVFRCCSPDQAMKSINWDILIVFAASVVLGLAIQKTGIAERLAMGILDVCGTNPLVVMTAICFVGTFITEFISNTAAGAMFFPIMYEAAEKLGYEPFPFLIALMISVSSSFATPIGSPTHMLVYGPGGYRFSDFMRIGLLMNLIILAANIFIVNLVYPLTRLP